MKGYGYMSNINKDKKYEKAEATFNTKNELDRELYNFVVKNSVIIGKSNYIKQLIYAEYQKSRE